MNMDFKSLVESIKKTKISTLRLDEADYFEAVFTWQEMPPVESLLASFFSNHVYRAPAKIPDAAAQLIGTFGGLRSGQTLYFLETMQEHYFAMCWPWGDGVSVTLKLGIKKPVPTLSRDGPKNIWRKLKLTFYGVLGGVRKA